MKTKTTIIEKLDTISRKAFNITLVVFFIWLFAQIIINL